MLRHRNCRGRGPDAPEGALRGIIAADWKGLGLKAPCNGGDNAVHASASPLEGMAERTNWLGVAIADDPFGKVLLAAGFEQLLGLLLLVGDAMHLVRVGA